MGPSGRYLSGHYLTRLVPARYNDVHRRQRHSRSPRGGHVGSTRFILLRPALVRVFQYGRRDNSCRFVTIAGVDPDPLYGRPALVLWLLLLPWPHYPVGYNGNVVVVDARRDHRRPLDRDEFVVHVHPLVPGIAVGSAPPFARSLFLDRSRKCTVAR